ncbi:MAG: GreA/GreB family elongation factor [Archangium sp.]|nr:GreA/GreB family elongation factor [Archangium sp.]
MQPPILLTERDHARLNQLVSQAVVPEHLVERLEAELLRATIVPFSRDVVQLGSLVTWETEQTRQVRTARLIAPPERAIGMNEVSVLTPVGCALIGLRAGDVFTWVDGSRQWRLRVVAVENEAVLP